MIQCPYQGLPEFPVKNKVNLFQTGLVELANARNIMNTARRILRVTEAGTDVVLVGEKSEFIKLVFSDSKLGVLMYMYYIPKTRRLDIYDGTGMICAFEKKRCIFSRATEGLNRFGFTDLFKTLVTIT